MPTVMPLRPDDRRHVGRYRLTGRVRDLAAGNDLQGVFLAKRPSGETVVVSLLGENPAADAAARDRFTAEGRAARRVPPFCIARILDAGFDGMSPYLVTEHVPGPSLAEVIAQEGPVPADNLGALAIGCVTGLAAIHQSGLVHGNLRPANVILSPGGPRITGFSITPPYGTATPAADMMAWAHTMMAAAVGRPPVGPQDLALVPGVLRPLVAACLSPDPASRPASRAALAELLEGQDISAGLLAAGSRAAQRAAHTLATPDVPPPPSHPPRRSPMVGWAVGGAVCVAVLAVAGILIARSGGGHPGTAGSLAAGKHPSTHTHAAIPGAFAGNWSGIVRQTDPVLAVPVHISLAAGSATGKVAYPTLGCSGTLTVTSTAHGQLTLHQAISTGRRKCANGVITLTPEQGGDVAFTFLRPGGQNPSGSLSHQG